ncbi:two-pore potassium channel 1-like [Actinidia eriantha]|uniref:two-pore potassium channel 1-like n=1 Tax=Actinidia eriantha TaxID=165200 RepID=UPI00258C2FEF|nr:two-pore potassium channel 1-like [Actinidia eriantha]
MASDDAKEPLLSESTHPSNHFNEKNALKRRRYRRGSNAQTGIESLPHPDLISSKEQLSLKRVSVYFGIYLGLGTLCFFLVKDHINGKKTNVVIDAMYFCVVTMTTVGYGDLVPNTVLAKLLSCIFVFTGMGLVGFVLSKAADYIVEKEEILLVKAIHMREKVGPSEILKEVESNKAKYKFFTSLTLLLVLVIVGTVFLSQFEELDLVDALYCVCATISTLGYGDESFSTQGGRLFAVFWILMSTICLAQFFLYLAEMYTENRQRSLIKWALTRKLTNSDLEAADLDNDKVVSVAEFIVYKLKEMGKISDEDISVVMEGFKNLDVDHSGTLTASEGPSFA